MGRIFDVDSEKSENNPDKQTSSDRSSSSDKATPSNRLPHRRTVVLLTLVGILALGLVGILGAVGVYTFRAFYPSSQAAPSKEAKTKLEAFQGKAGIVLVKSYSDLGSVLGQTGGIVQIKAMELQDRKNGSRAAGLLISVKASGEFGQQSRSFIDYDEIDSLIAGIDYITGITSPTAPLKSFEAQYRTRGDFSILTFNQTDGTIAAAVSGTTIGSNDVFLRTQDITTLKNYVVSAKKILDTLE